MSPAVVVLLLGAVLVFAAILLVFVAVGVVDNHERGVARSLTVLQAFSTAPQALQADLEPSFNDRVLAPLLARALVIGRRFTPSDHADRIRRKLEVAGNPAGWNADRVVALKVIGFAVGLVGGLLAGAALGFGLLTLLLVCIGAALLGYQAPNLYLYQVGYDRTEKVRRALPDAIDLLTISIESGLGFDAALAQVARNTDGPLAEEFARVLQEMQIGLGRGAALRALGERSEVEELVGFVSAMVQADSLGIPVGQVLRVQSQEIRTKRRQAAEAKAQKVAVKIMVPLIFCILPCLFIAVMGPAAIGIFTSLR